MTKYIKIFNTAVELLAYHNDDPITPCVSFSETDEVVMYLGYDKMYLTIEPTEADGYLYVSVPKELYTNQKVSYISYRIDNGNWISIDITTATTLTEAMIPVEKNHTIQLKGDYIGCNNYDEISIDFVDSRKHSLSFNAYGNIMSLVYGDNFNLSNSQVLLEEFLFFRLFYKAGIIDASNLILSLLELIPNCYACMFEASALVYPPKLPAIKLTVDCYSEMFADCTDLIIAPELPAIVLEKQCYCFMFDGCTSLTTAPILPATVLTTRCYKNMFNNCSSLNSITCYATDISATNCLSHWLSAVSQTGIFYKDANTIYPTGTSGIPDNWTVLNIN